MREGDVVVYRDDPQEMLVIVRIDGGVRAIVRELYGRSTYSVKLDDLKGVIR